MKRSRSKVYLKSFRTDWILLPVAAPSWISQCSQQQHKCRKSWLSTFVQLTVWAGDWTGEPQETDGDGSKRSMNLCQLSCLVPNSLFQLVWNLAILKFPNKFTNVKIQWAKPKRPPQSLQNFTDLRTLHYILHTRVQIKVKTKKSKMKTLCSLSFM